MPADERRDSGVKSFLLLFFKKEGLASFLSGPPMSLLRHVEAVQNVTLPGGRLPFRLGDAQVGWVGRDAAALLLRLGCEPSDGAIVLPAARDLPALARSAAEAGAFAWRDEAFDVRAVPDGDVLATVDRGALPWLGIAAEGVHVNGLVPRPDGLHVWIAQRAANRPIDPGKLDHLFAGGIAAGSNTEETLLKEGAEEAGLSAAVVGRAAYVGTLRYTVARPEGLRRDRLHCYDLVLPEDVRPAPADGEVAGFALWPVARVIERLRETDDFKFNVALVLIDMLLRLDVLPRASEETRLLRAVFRR